MSWKKWLRNSAFLVAAGIAFCLLMSCVSGGDKAAEPTVPYDGVGLHQSDPQATLVTGSIQYKNFGGGEILVEARRSIPCGYGRCPIIGEPALAKADLSAPGPFTLNLAESAKDLMIIATLRSPEGRTRVAHTYVLSEATEVPGLDLSLDRPYPPLR